MATSGRLSFTVRSLLDLPEQDAQHLRRREPELGAPGPGPCAAWLESERGHYPCEYAEDRGGGSGAGSRTMRPTHPAPGSPNQPLGQRLCPPQTPMPFVP